MLIVAVAWTKQISESVYDTRGHVSGDTWWCTRSTSASACAHGRPSVLICTEVKSTEGTLEANQMLPPQCSSVSRFFFLLFWFFLRVQKSKQFVQHLQQTWQRSGNVDLGLAEAKMQGDAMAAIRYSLILTAANGRQTSKWRWRGGREEDGELDGVVNNDIMGLFHKTEQFLQTTHFLCFLSKEWLWMVNLKIGTWMWYR